MSPQHPGAAWYPADAQQQQQHLQPHSLQQQSQQPGQHELHAVGPWVSSSSTSSDKAGGAGSTATGIWRILWNSGGMQQHLTFEATQETREALHRHTNRWLHGASNSGDDYNGAAAAAGEPQAEVLAAAVAAAAGGAAGSENGALEIAMPRHLTPGAFTPRLSEPSIIISAPGGSGNAGLGAGAAGSSSRPSSPGLAVQASAGGAGNTSSSSSSSAQQHQLVDGLAHLASALPARYQSRDWSLLYSTSRHGISLQTLYRRCAASSPSVLLVRDAGGYVFGAFCAEAWRPAARFFGTGETFVFQLAPHKVMFPWQVRCRMTECCSWLVLAFAAARSTGAYVRHTDESRCDCLLLGGQLAWAVQFSYFRLAAACYTMLWHHIFKVYSRCVQGVVTALLALLLLVLVLLLLPAGAQRDEE
jgi:hypothetical protein